MRAAGGRLDVRAEGPGLLVVSEGWDLGWSAEVDGAPARVARVNGAEIGVPLAAGRHRVPPALPPAGAWRAGLALAAVGALGLLAWGPARGLVDLTPGRGACYVSLRRCSHAPCSPSLSIFFPAYNDAGTIASLALVAHMTARQITDDYEVIVVDDGSPDHTGELLDEMARHFSWLKVVHHEKNRGYGGALRTGFETASKELVFYTDGDAQYDPRELSKLYEAWRPEIDFVNGYKIGRSDPLHRIVIGRVYHWFVKLVFGLRLRDVDCDFRLMRRERVRQGDAHPVLGRHLRRAHEEGPGPRVPHRRGPRAPLPPHATARASSSTSGAWRKTLLDLMRLWDELVVRREHLRGKRAAAPEATPPRLKTGTNGR